MSEFRNQITYNQLITFKAIFESGNISRAAKLLEVSPASVSSSLKILEKQIGQVLFNRSTRAITATDIGNQLYANTQIAINDLTSAVDAICDLNEQPCGKLSINLAHSIYHWFVRKRLIEFRRVYPQVELELTLSDTLDSRIEQQFDIGFRYGERVEESLIARKLNGTESLKAALFVSKEYAALHGIPKSLSELSSHPMVKLRMPSSRKLAPLRLHKTEQADSEIVAIETTTAMVVNDMAAIVDMVSQGFGMGMMLDIELNKHFESGELIPVLQQHWCDIPNVYMYYARESKQSLTVKTFVDFMLS